MRQSSLKGIRVIVSLVFFLFITFILLDFSEKVPPAFSSGVLAFQFIPSLLKFITVTSITAAGFMLLILLTALFGRVYCSAICPLGTLQDVVTWLQRKLKRRHRYRYNKPVNYLRYGFLLLTVIVFFTGSILLVNLLDPYSNYGRIASGLFRPVYMGVNNLLASVLSGMDIYYLHPEPVYFASWPVYIYPGAVLIVLIVLSLKNGRLFCNLVCPVGTLLGLISRGSLFRIRMAEEKCTKCGKCAVACKSACIRVKNLDVDFSRCVACFNCLKVCPEDAIKYEFAARSGNKAIENGKERRRFLQLVLGGLSLSLGIPFSGRAKGTSPVNENPTVIEEAKTYPVSPPGSLGLKHFTDTCTACHLCVSACPTGVLQPSLFEYGFAGIMQPRMDYHTNYCNFECTICSEVCPTGAILPLTPERKETVQIGQVQLILENCVVYAENTACGSCSEHCPTQAVRMVPYINDLTIPEITPEICVGCGACEHACPTRPFRAIYVDGHYEHQVARKPEIEELEETELEDFPF